ncbi:hypothetical protein CHUAL_012841 [Chamberlinius hualienensis]
MDEDEDLFITQNIHVDYDDENYPKRRGVTEYPLPNKREIYGADCSNETFSDRQCGSLSPILFSNPNVKKVDGEKLFNNLENVPQATKTETPVSSNAASSNTTSRLMEKFKRNFAQTQPTPLTANFVDQNAIAIGMCVTDLLEDIDSQFDCETFYGLPRIVKQLLEKERGIKQLYDWQHKCLTLDAVSKRRNLIYCLPTSGGKTLVAEILLWREVVRMDRDAILILPYVAIVQEKFRLMEEFSIKLNFFLEEYAGRKGHIPPTLHRKKRTLYVATIEKANMLINYLIESKTTDRMGMVVVDEMHMVGDGDRGCTLEMILTKLKFAFESTMIVGMSATIGNLDDLKEFLNAEIYTGDFRPVELKEYIKINNKIFHINVKAIEEEQEFVFQRHFPVATYYPNSNSKRMDPDCVAGLILEVIPSASCLVFCKSKSNCENVAKLVCSISNFTAVKDILLEHKYQEKMDLLNELKRDNYNQLCPILKQTIPYGVAYHHAGLTTDERLLIEEAFTEGTLVCLAATSTLAAGVNLPAQRVIVREPRIANSFISCSRLKQMVGRAGRAGLNECGESFLIVQENDVLNVKKMLLEGNEPCMSSMIINSGKGFKTFILNAISIEMVQTRKDLLTLLSNTLLAVQQKQLLEKSLEKLMDEAIDELIKADFIYSISNDSSSKYIINKYGKATCKGGLDLEWARMLTNDLQLNLQSLVLFNTWLHLLYLIIPYDQVEALGYLFDPRAFHNQYFKLEPDEMKVAEVIGITEGIAVNIGKGCKTKLNTSTIYRFHLAMVLNRLWKMDPMWDVASTFKIPRGSLQNFLYTSCHFAQNILQFCQEMEHLTAFCDLLPSFIQRLYHCAEPELLPLMELPAVKRARASLLYKAGYKDIQAVAKAQPDEMVKAVIHLPLKVARNIIKAAKNQIRKKVEELEEEIEIMKSEVQ